MTRTKTSLNIMLDVLSFFSEDKATYAPQGVVMYNFDDTRRNEFITYVRDFYRRAFISDKELKDNMTGLGSTRKEEIEEVLPTDPIIKSGDFGEILTFAIFKQLHPEYNLTPIRWRWKEERDRAVHFADIMFLCCPDDKSPQPTDKMMTVEVKTRATKPANQESSINNAIKGALKDSVSRGGKTLLFLKRWLKKDKDFDGVRIVKRFENCVPDSYEEYHNAIAVVDRQYLNTYHIANLEASNIKEVADYNAAGAKNHKGMAVFVVPLSDLKTTYEKLYTEIKNS